MGFNAMNECNCFTRNSCGSLVNSLKDPAKTEKAVWVSLQTSGFCPRPLEIQLQLQHTYYYYMCTAVEVVTLLSDGEEEEREERKKKKEEFGSLRPIREREREKEHFQMSLVSDSSQQQQQQKKKLAKQTD